ncbi:MAG: hypothetical protein A2X64_00520 [Ignavibacteria bacterium GWF2_33_9]|nr:MAG: hypothetical protein A2X64_00520 [Ignavibacteria bacterium GWF2_33_9]
MKKLITLSAFIVLFSISSAFALPNFWYSGVAYNAGGQIINTSPLASVEVTVSDGTNTMIQTIPNVPVNAFGIFNVFVNGPGLSSVTMKSNSSILIKVNDVTCIGSALSSINLSSYNYGDYIELNSSEVNGVLPVQNGGTGRSSLTNNALLAGNNAGNVQSLPYGTNGQILTSNGNGSLPTWVDPNESSTKTRAILISPHMCANSTLVTYPPGYSRQVLEFPANNSTSSGKTQIDLPIPPDWDRTTNMQLEVYYSAALTGNIYFLMWAKGYKIGDYGYVSGYNMTQYAPVENPYTLYSFTKTISASQFNSADVLFFLSLMRYDYAGYGDDNEGVVYVHSIKLTYTSL